MLRMPEFAVSDAEGEDKERGPSPPLFLSTARVIPKTARIVDPAPVGDVEFPRA